MNYLITLSLLLACWTVAAGELHTACQKGDLATVKRIVQANPAAVNEIHSNGWTPLMFAVRTNKAVVEFLITNKADVNVATKQKDTALHLAVVRGTTETVELLLKNGADVNARNDQGQNAAYLVVRGRRDNAKQILELLIRHKVDLNVRDKDGFTVLDGARGSTGTELHSIVKRAGGRGGNFPD